MENTKCLVWLPKQSKSGEIIFYAKADGEISFNESLMGMNDNVRAQICRLRSTEYHSEEYNKIKETIPMVWTGAYSYSWLRRKAEVTEIYNIITIDVDYAENKELFDREGIEVIKYELASKIPYCYYAGLSAGGYGFVLYLLTENLTLDNEPYVFNYFCDIFKKAGIIIDNNAKDLITRFRKISYDENAYWNKEAIKFDCDKVSVDDVDIVNNSNKTKIVTSNFYKDGENNTKLKVDSNIKIKIKVKYKENNITKYKDEIISGNEIRWRINIIAEHYFGDNAKEWCDKHFYFENGRSIYAKVTNKHNIPNSYVTKWLIDNNFLQTKTEGAEIKEGEYLSDKIEYITKITDKYDRNLIVAPTGTGKTTLINGKNPSQEHHNGIKGLADYYDAVVITPYNNTNSLYDRCTLISSTMEPEFKYKDGKTVGKYVMNVDQAVKHWHIIRYKNIIIDECHTLFSERVFRKKMRQICNLLNGDFYGKLLLVTATPTGESELLNIENTIQFWQQRNNINVLFKYATTLNNNGSGYDSKKSFVNPICWSISNHYKKHIYDRIVLMDDMSAKDVYDALILKYNIPAEDILYYRADTSENEDCKQMIKEEKLMKKITICTRIAFNGLNFKNENENVLVITSFTPGSLIAANIIQMIGRVRKSDVTCLCYYNNAAFIENIIDYDDKMLIKHEQEKYPLTETLYRVNELYNDLEWVDSVKKIDKYFIEHSGSIELLTQELANTNYITCKVLEKIITSFTTTNYRKKQEKQIIKNYIKEAKNMWNKKITVENFNDYTYIPEWVEQYKQLISRYNENENAINSLLLKRLAITNASFENILSDIKMYCNICSISEKEYAELLCAYASIIQTVTINIKNKEYVEKLNDKVDKIKKIREKLTESFSLNEVLYAELADAEQARENKQKKSVEGGKIGGKIGKKCVITEKMKARALKKYNISVGQSFESSQELCDYVKKSNKTITEWRNKGWIE